MMKKILIGSLLLCLAQISLAQNNKFTKLAKKEAKALCECPSNELIAATTEAFRAQKIGMADFQKGIQVAFVQMTECSKPFEAETKKLNKEEYKLYRDEVQKQMQIICPPKPE